MDGHTAPASGGFRPAGWVTHAKFDDEIIAIDLETGAYFAMDGAAALVFSALGDGATIDSLAHHVTSSFEVESDRAREDIEAFVAQLVTDRLAEPCAPADDGTAPTRQLRRLPYESPQLEKFDDLEELLLLDPIHEVDEAGWPVRRDA